MKLWIFACAPVCLAGMLVDPSRRMGDVRRNLLSRVFVLSTDLVPVEKLHDSSGRNSLIHGPGSKEAAYELEEDGLIPYEDLPSTEVLPILGTPSDPLVAQKLDFWSAENPELSKLLLKSATEGNAALLETSRSITLHEGSSVTKAERVQYFIPLKGGLVEVEYSNKSPTHLPTYVSFSRPVLLQKLWVQVGVPASDDAGKTSSSYASFKKESTLIVACRLGLKTVWSTKAIVAKDSTVDATALGFHGHPPLEACTQLVVFSNTRHVKVEAIRVDEPSTPVKVPLLVLSGDDATPELKMVSVDSGMLVSRQVVPLYEAKSKGLTLRKRKPKRASEVYSSSLPAHSESSSLSELPDRKAQSETLKRVAERHASEELPIFQGVDMLYQAIVQGDLEVPYELRKRILESGEHIAQLAKDSLKRLMMGELRKIAGEIADSSSSGKTQADKDSAEKVSKRDREIADWFINVLLHT